MKISYSYEQSETETESIQKTCCCVVEKLINFGERVMNIIAQDKAASRASFKDDQISQLAHTVEILSNKIDRMENRVNSNETSYKFKNNK